MEHREPSNREKTYSELKLTNERLRLVILSGLSILLVGALLYVFGIVLNVLAVPVGIVIWTTIFVFCLKGSVNHMEARGISRGWGVLITYIVFLLVFGVVVGISVSPMFGVGEQFTNLLANTTTYIASFQGWFNEIYTQYAPLLQDQTVRGWINDALSSIGNAASAMASQSAQSAVAIGSGVGATFMIIGFALVVAYWVLLELPAMGREIRRLFGPRFHEDLDIIYLTGTRVMGGYIKGTVLQCALIGVLCGIGFAIMDIPSFAALAAITALLNVIPVVGAWIGGVLVAIVGLFFDPLIGVIALTYTVIIQQVVYTFISPRIMGNSVNIHPALIIVALMAGSAIGMAMSGLVGSFVGALLSIPVVAMFKSLFVYYFERATGRRIVASDGVIFKGDVKDGDGQAANPLVDATGEIRMPDHYDGDAHRGKY